MSVARQKQRRPPAGWRCLRCAEEVRYTDYMSVPRRLSAEEVRYADYICVPHRVFAEEVRYTDYMCVPRHVFAEEVRYTDYIRAPHRFPPANLSTSLA